MANEAVNKEKSAHTKIMLSNMRKSENPDHPSKKSLQAALDQKHTELVAYTSDITTLNLSPQGAFPVMANNEDIKNLAAVLKENTSITTLNLQGNYEMTDKGAAVLLKALEKNMTLRTINLDATGMSEKAKRNFQKKLAQKFAPKTPGFFAGIWQGIQNLFRKSNAEGAGGVPGAVGQDLNNEDNYHNHPDRLAEVEQHLAVVPPQVAPQLVNPMPAAEMLPPGGAPAAAKTTAAATPMAPPILPIQKVLDELSKANIEIPDNNANNDFRDPLTLDIMVDPVIAADGGTYERESIKDFFASGGKISPLDANREKTFVNQDLKPDAIMQDKILNYLESLKPENQNRPPSP